MFRFKFWKMQKKRNNKKTQKPQKYTKVYKSIQLHKPHTVYKSILKKKIQGKQKDTQYPYIFLN